MMTMVMVLGIFNYIITFHLHFRNQIYTRQKKTEYSLQNKSPVYRVALKS